MDAVVIRLSSSFLLFTLSTLLGLALLGCALGLLGLELNPLQAVVCALVVQLCVLGGNLLTSRLAVTATSSTEFR